MATRRRQASISWPAEKLTKQTFAILWRIREWMSGCAHGPTYRSEFWRCTQSCASTRGTAKPRWRIGRRAPRFQERHRLCEGWLPGAFDRVRDGYAGSEVADDDILDAIAALWTAERLMTGQARRVPEEPDRDPCGLPMQMLA